MTGTRPRGLRLSVAAALAALTVAATTGADAADAAPRHAAPARRTTTRAVTATATTTGATAPAVGAGRAMWVWTREDPQAVVDFATAHGLRVLFVAVPWNVGASADLLRLQRLSALARAAGLRVDALGGDPAWVDDPAAALRWQADALATGLFTGVHLDVEPWTTPAWGTDQAAVVAAYVDLLRQVQAASTAPLEVDVPFWFGQVPAAGGSAADAVLSVVDAVTEMTYRTSVTGPNSVTDVGADLLARGAAAGKGVRLALETGADPACPSCTFAGGSAAAVGQALAGVEAAEAGTPAFTGVAVEDYAGWAALG